uniref:nucleotidyltransferase family protein n=1 Tax=Hylemonella sp. TaxID=2066020 RepID=UPI0035B2223C
MTRALLLAAGLGTRLRPLTNTVPKCMVTINGRPLLDYWLELLSRGGIGEVLVNLHYLPDPVREFLAANMHPLMISTVMEEQLLGTAGTLLRNRSFFRDAPVMLVHADNLSLFDVRAFVSCFERRSPDIAITMMTFYTDQPSTCGIVELDADGVVQAFHEKVENPPGNLANGAVYILAPEVIDYVASLGKEVIDFSTEVLPHYMGRINTFLNSTYHRDIGNLASLVLAQAEYPQVAARHAQGRADAANP